MKNLFSATLRSSVLWGLVATFGFYFALNNGLLQSETLLRYCAGHPVEYATTAMFFIGVCDLLFKLTRVARERKGLKRGLILAPKKPEKEPLDGVDEYLNTLQKARAVRGGSAFLTRLADALNFLKFGGDPNELDQELRCLADDDADARDAEYGMVKMFIWAIPILGFLGTVLGITVALGNLDLTRLEATGELLAAGLKVAFDTTALALTLVFVLYFTMFYVKKRESELADAVAKLVDEELKGRFLPEAAPERDATGRAVADALREIARTQTALWADALQNVAAPLGDALDKTLQSGAANWSRALAETQREFIDSTLRPALDASARQDRRVDALETKIERQTEALAAALRAAADVAAIEERLAQTLEKIA
ncbi:MAG: MotA/TolQ/ExbB proton channel family protein, partial [Thermoguttaceae bacterium]|nr:MotA/TolQ/ExbB proton channel family protein [Thermoguttaceae bacterium]